MSDEMSPEVTAEPVPADETAPEVVAEVAVEGESADAVLAEPEAEDEPVSEPAPEIVAEPAPAPAPEPEPAAEPEPEVAAEPAATPEPEAVPAAAPAPEPVSVPRKPSWTRVPFFVLGAVWLGFVTALVALLWPSAEPVSSPFYPYLVFGGTALVVLGFVTGLVVWLLVRSRAREDERARAARSIWLRALGWTGGGVVVWWIGLTLLDLHRAGVIR